MSWLAARAAREACSTSGRTTVRGAIAACIARGAEIESLGAAPGDDLTVDGVLEGRALSLSGLPLATEIAGKRLHDGSRSRRRSSGPGSPRGRVPEVVRSEPDPRNAHWRKTIADPGALVR